MGGFVFLHMHPSLGDVFLHMHHSLGNINSDIIWTEAMYICIVQMGLMSFIDPIQDSQLVVLHMLWNFTRMYVCVKYF